MRNKIMLLILLFTIIFPSLIHAKNISKLPEKYKKWLEQDVIYIITPKEEKTFKKLETDKQRDLFIEEFWRQRDPTPGTPQNEFKDEHYRRIEYVNKRFEKGTAKPEWKTERGRIYIILGEPIYRQQFSAGQDIYPIELWFYQGNVSQGLESFFYIVFFKRYGHGDFKLYSPLKDGPNQLCPATSHQPWDPRPELRGMTQREMYEGFFGGGTSKDLAVGGPAYAILYRASIDLAQASLSLIPGGSSISPVESDKLLGHINTYPQKNVDDEYTYEFLESKGVVEVNYSVNYIGNTSVVKVFQDESERYFVHYSIQPQNLSVNTYEDRFYSNIKVSGRVADLEGRTVFQYDKEYPVEFSKEEIKQAKLIPMVIQDSFPLVPGKYRFSLLLQNTVSKEFTSFDTDIILPEIEGILQMSELVLAFREEKDHRSLKSSFKIGEIKLYPSLRKEFTPQDTIYLFFQLSGLPEELIEEGWIKYIFIKEGKEEYVKKRKIKEYELGMNFLEAFSLKEFPLAKYRISASVLDKNEREVLSVEESFSLLSRIHQRPWILFKRYPASGDPVYSFIVGTQLLSKGEMEKAEDELRKAYEMEPEKEDFAIVYARVLLSKKDYGEVKSVLNPFVERALSDYILYEILGEAHQGEEEYEEAISCYQRYVSHEGANFRVLNSIGECYFQIGNHRETLRAWEKSLEINPDQPEIKKKIEGIKKKQ